MGSQKPRASSRREVHAAQEGLEARVAAEEDCGETAEGQGLRLRLSASLGQTPLALGRRASLAPRLSSGP